MMGSGVGGNRRVEIDGREGLLGISLVVLFFGGGVIVGVACWAGVLRVATVADETASVQGSWSSRENSRPCCPDAS